jgi:hypothetical protein
MAPCAVIVLQVLNPGCRAAGHKFAGVESIDEWPNVKSWLEKLAALDTVKAGYAIP